jgi:cytochrome c oxidase subunit II
MKQKTTLFWALVLIAVGVIGLGFTFVSATLQLSSTFQSSGQRIYYTGQDAGGQAIPRTVAGRGMLGLGMAGEFTCVDCHGEDGRGGTVGMMFGAIDIPDIRYSELTTPRSEDGTVVPAWTDAQIARAIRDGVEPNGESLKAPMPRWDMTNTELTDVISYLKELDAR